MSEVFLRKNIRVTAALALLIALLVVPGPAGAVAVASGRIAGIVKDSGGGAVALARVALRHSTGAIVAQTMTDEEGRYALEAAAGMYSLTVEASGFSLPEKILVEVRGGETRTIDASLIVSAMTDQMVVSATRTATPIDEVSGSIDVVSEASLRLKSHVQITEPLRLIPGLAVAQTGSRGGVTSIFTRGGESDYNKVLIDGVPVNAAGGLFDFAFLTPENIERVEVARGPRSALFGSDAMTGVIQLFTRRGATTTPELELSGEGGSYNYHRETAALSGLVGRFDYSASYGYQKTGGPVRNSDFLNRSASTNLGLSLTPAASLRFNGRLNNSTLGVPGPTGRRFSDPDQRQKHRDLALATTLDLRTSSRWYQTARFIFSEFDTLNFDPAGQDLTQPNLPPISPGDFSDSAFTFIDHQRRAGVHYQAVAVLNSANVLTVGAEFERESAVFTDDFSRVTPERNNFGVYVQDQFSWRDRWFVTAGVRIERNSGDTPDDLRVALLGLGATAPIGDVGFGVRANPKIAASVLTRRHQDLGIGATRVKASFGTGIKEPTLTEAFSPNIFFLGNPGLEPEQAVSFDVGMIQEFFNRRANFELTYFDNRFRDQIAFTFDPVTFGAVRLADGSLTNFINLERASARGVEVAARARPHVNVQIGASYTFLRSRLERADEFNREVGLPLLRRPRHSGSFDVTWREDRFDLAVDGSLVGRRRDLDPISGARFDQANQAIYNDGYSLLNLAGTYHLTRRLAAFARIENLLNQKYEEVYGFPANRLNFRLGMRLRIGKGV